MPRQRVVAEEVPEEEDDISTVGTPEQLAPGDEPLLELDEDDVLEADADDAEILEKAAKKPIKYVRRDDNDRMTPPIMSPATAAALIAIRTEQIGKSGTAMIDTSPYATNEQVARAELLAQKCPIIIGRPCGMREFADHIAIYVEYFRASELILPKAIHH